MRNRSSHKTETFNRAAWFARKGDDERTVDDSGEISRKNCVWCNFHRFGAHHFAEPRQLHPHNPAYRVRRDIAFGNSGSTGRQDESTPLPRERSDRVLDTTQFIRNDGFGQDMPAGVVGDLAQRRAAQVLVISGARAIGNRYDANGNFVQVIEPNEAPRYELTGFLVLLIKRISEIRISLSTALHMS